LSVLVNPNYVPKQYNDGDSFDSTKLDLDKRYSKGKESSIIQYIDKTMKMIKSNA